MKSHMPNYIVVATWPFGQIAVKTAGPLLAQGKPALDAAIAGAQAVEDDPKVHSVGYGGLPNSIGTVQLDACVMDGQTLSCGAVAAVENIRHVAALARRVMEKTPHILLAGEGARLFAVEQGFPLETVNTAEGMALWEKRKPKGKGPASSPPHAEHWTDDRSHHASYHEKHETEESTADNVEQLFGHDTVAVLALDQKGNLGAVCTTSGLPFKLPGRVGDSPLIGHGLYVDNTAGAAGGTGRGDHPHRRQPDGRGSHAIRQIAARSLRGGHSQGERRGCPPRRPSRRCRLYRPRSQRPRRGRVHGKNKFLLCRCPPR
jgi:N4-(beta-N-acetylglucosaminyl)-L-asparaginase